MLFRKGYYPVGLRHENLVFDMSQSEVRQKFERGLGHFFEKERKLLESGVREDSLAHKLAEHLGVEFAGFDVDAEYDKMHVDGIPHQKKYIGSEGREHGAIPDIIVHRAAEDGQLHCHRNKKDTK
jgi:hypothetical protein